MSKTPNPPIRITLDAVGVYDSGDSFLRGTQGEQYLFFIVSDGKNTNELRLPAQEYFHLDKDDIVSVGSNIFYTPEVGSAPPKGIATGYGLPLRRFGPRRSEGHRLIYPGFDPSPNARHRAARFDPHLGACARCRGDYSEGGGKRQ